LTIAVLVIIITAPIGSALIAILGPRLLNKASVRIVPGDETTLTDPVIVMGRNMYVMEDEEEEEITEGLRKMTSV
jgi:hypothetical protein